MQIHNLAEIDSQAAKILLKQQADQSCIVDSDYTSMAAVASFIHSAFVVSPD